MELPLPVKNISGATKRSVCWVGVEMVDGGQDMVAGSKTAEKLSPVTQT